MKRKRKPVYFNLMIANVLLLFFVFSSGLSFSLHYCDSCKRTTAFFIEHPNCCAESEQIHQSEKQCSKDCGCCHEEHGQNPCNVEHHCKTTHKYIRIHSPFFRSAQPTGQPICCNLFDVLNFTESISVSEKTISFKLANPPPLHTQAGTHQFLNFVSQHTLYA